MLSTFPPASVLQSLIDSAATPTTGPTSDLARHHRNLALQIAHNLQHQHRWTNVCIVSHGSDDTPLSRPILSGLPPQRLYIHPDEQIEILQAQKDAGSVGLPKLASEREWVLPSHLREKWSLRRFGEIFAKLDWVPSNREGEALLAPSGEANDQTDADGEVLRNSSDVQPNPWRTKMPKRLLLATLDDDSTIVYYIVHDGIVKPRQN